MKLKLLAIFLLCIGFETRANDSSAWVGSFSRMGFGSRGIGMGNAGNAVIHGSMGSYYNPATISFTTAPTLDASMAFLSLDRSLNFFQFSTRVPPAAGFSVSVINAGVSNIDQRNRDGLHQGYASTSENMFTFAFGLQFSDVISAGIAFKLYYYRLSDYMSSTTLGIDFGLIYRPSTNFTLAATVKDFNSKYKWDSTPLYEQQGRTTTDAFPLLFQLGGSYLSDDKTLLVTVSGEYSNALDFILRSGVEAYVTENVVLRGGIDNLLDPEVSKPSLGFGIHVPVRDWNSSFNYTLVFEPQAPSSLHVISVGIEF